MKKEFPSSNENLVQLSLLVAQVWLWKFFPPAILSNLTVGTEKAHNWNYPRWASLMAQRVKRLPAMQETQVQSLGWEDPLEKEMVTHSSILAWKIPWTEEPGRLQSMGSQRVGHD